MPNKIKFKVKVKKCPKGHILRKSFKRKDYISKSGDKKIGKVVPEKCVKKTSKVSKMSVKTTVKNIKKQANKLNKPKIVIPMKKGELTKHGYHKVVDLSLKKRRSTLNSAVKEFGASKILKKLGVIRTYHKNKNPHYSRTYSDNMKWLRKEYDNQFKSSWKNSALYKK